MSSRSVAVVVVSVLAGGGAAMALGAGGSRDSSVALGASQSVSPNTSIPGDATVGLAQDPAGQFLTTTVNFSTQGRVSAALVRVPRVGGRAISTPIVRRPTGAARVSNALTAVSPVGAVAAYSRRVGARSRSRVFVTTVRPDGQRVSAPRVPGLAGGASPYVLAMGPTGAVALASTVPGARGGEGPAVVFSFRPAGATRFAQPVTLPGASVPSADGTLNSDLVGSVLSLAMAPDGGAAIIDGPASTLRRVTPDGVVGEEHRVSSKFASVTIAAFRQDGTLVAASTHAIESKTKTIDDQYYSSQITIAEWPPTASEPTVRALPVRPGEVESGDNFTLGLGPEGRTILTLADGDDHLAVLSGTGTAIEPVGRVRAPRAYEAHAFPTSDGGTALVWAPDGITSAKTLMTATAPPGSTLGTPRAIRTPSKGSIEVQSVLPLPDGRIAIAYGESAGEQRLLIAQP